MESTTVVTSGKGSNPKTTLYVGGLDVTVVESHLFSAFVPFGDIRDVTIPIDYTSGKHRGFGFVEYEEADDAAAAVENMHNSELFGRVLRVNYAQPMRIKGDKAWSHQAVWADADKYFEEQHVSKDRAEETQKTRTEPTETPSETPPVASQPVANPMEDLEKALV